jgi:hypothetical protein
VSLYDYEASKQLALNDPPFAALIMAAMRKADTDNQAKLRAAWPDVWAELDARYHAPGGRLPEDAPAPAPADRPCIPGEDECEGCYYCDGEATDDEIAAHIRRVRDEVSG